MFFFTCCELIQQQRCTTYGVVLSWLHHQRTTTWPLLMSTIKPRVFGVLSCLFLRFLLNMHASSVFAFCAISSCLCSVEGFAFRHDDCRCIADVVVQTDLVPCGGDGGVVMVVILSVVEALRFLILIYFFFLFLMTIMPRLPVEPR